MQAGAKNPAFEVTKTPSRVGWTVLQILAALACLPVVIANVPQGRYEPIAVVGAAALVVIALLEFGRAWRSRRKQVTFRLDGEMLRCERRIDAWEEPLADYTGVVWQRFVERGNGNGGRREHHTLTLSHTSDATRDVPLVTAASARGIRRRWEGFARQLNVSAIRELPDKSRIVREPANLDKSIRELFHENQLALSDVAPPVPANVTWDRATPNMATVVLSPLVRSGGFVVSFIVPFCAVLAVVSGASWWALITLAAPLLTYLVLRGYRLTILGPLAAGTPGEEVISTTLRVGGLTLRTRHLPVNRVEEVWVSGSHLHTLRIDSDDGALTVKFLPLDAVAWLEHFVLCLAAGEPMPTVVPTAGGTNAVSGDSRGTEHGRSARDHS